MRILDIIEAKREGRVLSEAEIQYFMESYCAGAVPDYQASALLMAFCCHPAERSEAFALTRAMLASGKTLDWSEVAGVKVDKHSTGGVGDKLTLVIAPLLAAAGLKLPKLSGRGLGHTGGTLDKLESIPGLSTELPEQTFRQMIAECGAAVISQSEELVPADRKLYALRDVTATVRSISLIASSIMSKKLAAGSDKILLEVTVGNGAYMRNLREARKLAEMMVEIGAYFGKETEAVLTDMNQPLGWAIGNALEVQEALETLRGGGPNDLRELALYFGVRMLRLVGSDCGEAQDRAKLEQLLDEGAALERFCAMVRGQGGDVTALLQGGLPSAQRTVSVSATLSGRIQRMQTDKIGALLVELGGGRQQKGEKIDPAVGIVLRKKLGDRVERGEELACIHYQERMEAKIAAIRDELRGCLTIGSRAPAPHRLILGVIEKK